MSFEVVDFTEGDYYKNGTLTVKRGEKQYVIGSLLGDNETMLFSYLSFVDNECVGWSKKRQQSYYYFDDEYDDDGEPLNEEEVVWFANEEERHNWLLQSQVIEAIGSVEELQDAIDAYIDHMEKEEANRVAFELKFGGGPIVLHKGLLTDLIEWHGKNLSIEDMLGERDGTNHLGKVIYLAGRYCVEVDQHKTSFTVYCVTDEDCEPWDSYKDEEAAKNQMLALYQEDIARR